MELYYSEKFNPEELALLGRAIGTATQGTIVVGRDGRAISRYGKRALVVGIVSTGSTVMDVRLIPMIALRDFAKKKGYPFVYVYYYGGVRVEISGLEVEEVKAIAESRAFVEAPPNDIGATVYYPNALDDLLYELFRHYNFTIGGKALVDCMNTPAALLFPRLNERFGFEVELINDMMTSYLPPKPKEVFLQKLSKGEYDFGLRFRPDGIAEVYKDNEVKEFDSLWKLLDHLAKF
ncbi:phospho-sugar mutase [Pyrococcus furiosus DSM 3638]|uniref:Phospho-sugar mutase n=3 Tax=Pyrococcus furiosus TaxID=2261 RepID=A0A5C0XRX1_PYRFU|nr:phospho-sugar mutase [Pyrococcus furiosus]AAL81853.1 phospho-sugar mutase [Pyrococcus furiosus DSM 3638]AFN04913.1 phospho-sugar mutase [Pyrococcus furiosus COM1]QEK79345.1 phospho-sugar mutase [Pyrococcus furiosus DSM 3638]